MNFNLPIKLLNPIGHDVGVEDQALALCGSRRSSFSMMANYSLTHVPLVNKVNGRETKNIRVLKCFPCFLCASSEHSERARVNLFNPISFKFNIGHQLVMPKEDIAPAQGVIEDTCRPVDPFGIKPLHEMSPPGFHVVQSHLYIKKKGGKTAFAH
jgi:hypothetical protein